MEQRSTPMALQLQSLTVEDLKGKLRELSLPVSGRKGDLIYRLLDYHYTQRLNGTSLAILKGYAKKVGVNTKENKEDMVKELEKLSMFVRRVIFPDVYYIEENSDDSSSVSEDMFKGIENLSISNASNSKEDKGSKKRRSPYKEPKDKLTSLNSKEITNGVTGSPLRVKSRDSISSVPNLILQIKLNPEDLNERTKSELSDLPMLVKRINTLLQGHLFTSEGSDNIKTSLLIEPSGSMEGRYMNI